MNTRPIQYDEPVIFKDIDAELEYAREGMNNFTEFYYRLLQQGAPQSLVQEMAEVAQMYKQTVDRLERILYCFPKG